MERINYYEALTGLGYTKILAVKGKEDHVITTLEELDSYYEQGYSLFADRNLVEEIEPTDRLLTDADVLKAIKEHMDFLSTEYGIIQRGGVLISSSWYTPEKIYSTFAEKFDCGLYFDNDKPVIIFTKTGHRVAIKPIESIYPPRLKVSSQEAQHVLMAMYKNTFSSLTEIAELLSMDEDKVKQIYFDMKKGMGELV